MDEEKEFILIESYLDGDLSGQALSDFEQRLSNDLELAKEVDLHRDLNKQLIRQEQKKALRKEWTQIIEAETKSGEQAIPQRKLFYYLSRIAATVVIGLTLYFIWPSDPSDQQLALQYWEETASFQASTIDRSDMIEPTYLKLLRQAYSAYEVQEYQKVISICNRLEPPLDEVFLLLGAAHFALKNEVEAIKNFEYILKQPESPSKDEAKWYLALAHLQGGDREQAQQWLQTIIAQKSWNHEQAKILLHKLKSTN